jgi:hypothetical protein
MHPHSASKFWATRLVAGSSDGQISVHVGRVGGCHFVVPTPHDREEVSLGLSLNDGTMNEEGCVFLASWSHFDHYQIVIAVGYDLYTRVFHRWSDLGIKYCTYFRRIPA